MSLTPTFSLIPRGVHRPYPKIIKTKKGLKIPRTPTFRTHSTFYHRCITLALLKGSLSGWVRRAFLRPISTIRTMATSTNGVNSSTAASAPAPILVDNMASSTDKPKKLHGRAFYESIGSPKFVLAPMVDQSEFVRLPPSIHPSSATPSTAITADLTLSRPGACSPAPT